MTTFRTNTPDAPAPIKQKRVAPGTVPPNKLAVYDAQGRRRGHVGRLASAATVNRLGVPNAKLSTDADGRACWRGQMGSK